MSIPRNEIINDEPINDEPRLAESRKSLRWRQGDRGPGAVPGRLLACQVFSIFTSPLFWF
ncbi:hypothetical protein [Candidimonas nitroreducens]|uniref:hypothetical protein n=1 Tax=Candidimonas nitroreducens TaxID=683354 RepID=UPI00117811B9|nr:hypothetical protein [Candidimonas nitroreducens]